jgi:hypothetical protein
MSENDPYGSEGGAPNERPYPYFLAPATSCTDGKNARSQTSQTAPTVEQSDIVNHSYGWAE